jgi:hypothetical protein
MPLIPSESLNFPDGFRATVGWRLPKAKRLDEPASSHEVAPPSPANRDSNGQKDAHGRGSEPVSIPANVPDPNAKPEAAAATVEQPLGPALAAEQSSQISAGTSMAEVKTEAPIETAETMAATDVTEPPQVSAPDPVTPAVPPQEAASLEPMPVEATSMEAMPSEAAPANPMTVPGSTVHALFMQALLARAVAVETTPAEPPSAESSPVESLPDQPAAAESVDTIARFSPPTPSPEIAPTRGEETSVQEIVQPELTFERSSAAPPPRKMPARIPITPRKWKPRSPVQTAAVPPQAESDLPNPMFAEPPPVPEQRLDGNGHKPLHQAPKEKPAAPRQPPIVTPESGNGPEKVSRPWAELARSEMELFAVTERRNRWIRFGLFESAALICVIVLTRLAFWHDFVDPTLLILVLILLVTAIVAAITLPVVFIRNSPERWQTRR